ncbi:MAG: anhydro-N-acetylmuramic acid kinase [Chitinophagaceae bacterium]
MIYRAIGVMSGSSLDGLDIAFAEFHENAGQWSYEIKQAVCYNYSPGWIEKLKSAAKLSALDYQFLHTEYGHYIGQQVNRFMNEFNFHYQVSLVASHGHTVFHYPGKKMTAQIGDGAAIAAETKLPVVSDLRSLDVAFGGQGAPIVPVGEKFMLQGYRFFLNLGGIANLSVNDEDYIGFDICAANRVLNLLANEEGKEFDEDGSIAKQGKVNEKILAQLNALSFYQQPFPKSLANEFGTDVVFPILKKSALSIQDALCTYVEHIVVQIKNAVKKFNNNQPEKMLVTGGGAFNTFLIERLKDELKLDNTEVVVPDEMLVKFKEAVIMALIGVLRWRQEYNVFASVTGAERNSIGGALWIGQEA